ncbi:MAG: NAD-dependent epimerase/dehydratase family protein [Anaerolineae bacterium]|nr:NAD-dependent epimerase/dehydratase family protein [Anaerolineae bacterium]
MIFVTGGTGFLGRHLVPALCHAGYPLRVLTRCPERHPWLRRYPCVEVIHGDLTAPETYASALIGCQSVVHAGGVFRMWGDESTFLDNNVLGTALLLSALKDLPIERLIYISTIAVLGQPDPDKVVDETYPPRPMDPYQRSKWIAEQMVLREWRETGLPVVVLRPGAYYGPLGTYAFNRLFFKDPMRGLIMQVDGGSHIIFPAYVGDAARGILLALACGRAGEVYNICGEWISHRRAFDIICEEAAIRWPRVPMPGWMDLPLAQLLEMIYGAVGVEPFWPMHMLRSYVHHNWRISNEKARRELGFVPVDFRDGARRTIAWYQAGAPEDWADVDDES